MQMDYPREGQARGPSNVDLAHQIARQPVASSNLHSVGYDPATRTLVVEFHGGQLYAYADVPPEHVSLLQGAPSPGDYFRRAIADQFAYRHLTPPQPEA